MNPNPKTNKTNADWLDSVLENFNTWDNCRRDDCQRYENYSRAKEAILLKIREAEKQARKDLLTEILVFVDLENESGLLADIDKSNKEN